MSNWIFNQAKTQARYEKLQDFYRQSRLNADDFDCVFFNQCSCSQKGNTQKQYAGGTAGLMPFYDLQYYQKEIRVLVVGKETGYMVNSQWGTSPNFDTNTANLLNCINWKKKNNHIKGTLLSLQHIFEVRTEYIYASYALSDALRCAFQAADRMGSISAVKDTSVMRKNCLGYLIEEIKILEPTLVIIQGEWAIRDNPNFVTSLANTLGQHPRMIKGNKDGKYGLYEFKDFMCLTSHHPAILGNWLVNLAPDSFYPMIAYLKEIGYLPTPDRDNTADYERVVVPIVDPIITKLPSNDYLRMKNFDGSIQTKLF